VKDTISVLVNNGGVARTSAFGHVNIDSLAVSTTQDRSVAHDDRVVG
jgi:hypothetical protein